MPTKKKRVGFIPREDVMLIIDKLSIENNLSNSKIISILVEEALSKRGIFNKKTGKVSLLYQDIQDSSQSLSEEPIDFKDNESFTINTKLSSHKYTGKKNLFKQTNQETFDLQTYKKFLSFLKFQEMMDEFKN
ncbi:hypothetical protein [Prochlorococcus marinus]|uniref:hypothetical protein n=1 Tax=Prochlorococcus marinus TaxID=1219 RepID=UPI001ADB3943|nr:hypothetical protein [Prochlorococcus marinus]MBO8219013.1 hypothetical protein [Prochlorococcus marinus CUG1416]MBW3051408.1 hypothetical protein [Prochlorococcus marinus str. MU1416]